MTTFTSILTKEKAEAFKRYLKAYGIYFEASECFDAIMIVIPMTEKASAHYDDIAIGEYNLLNKC